MKVLRVLVFEGPSDWIENVLEKCWLQPGEPKLEGAREILRTTDPTIIEDIVSEVGRVRPSDKTQTQC
jgi:hypothetical protein